MTKLKNIDFKNRYLILSDLDGTLLNRDSKLSPLTIKVVKKLTSMGHIFCIVTGRPLRTSYNIYKQLGLNTIIANFNGAMLQNPTRESFKEVNLTFNFEIVKKILTSKHILPYISNYVVENHEGTFFKTIPDDEKTRQKLYDAFHLHGGDLHKIIQKNFKNIADTDVHSVLLKINDAKALNRLLYEVRQFSKTLITRIWDDWGYGYILEINSIFATKGNALKFLSSYYSIDLSRTVTFGDGDNDQDMLTKAFYGYAMSNGTTTAKLSASFITEFDNNNDGVAKELIKLFKLKKKDLE